MQAPTPHNSDTQTQPCIGIDLGTTHSLIAVWQDGQARLIPNAMGQVLTPSVVSIADDGQVLIGQAAKDRLLTHPAHTASVFKRAMGTAQNFTLGQDTFGAEALSAMVLQSLKHDAQHALGIPIEHVIISVPAYFNDAQRKATRNAAHIAGLKVDRLVNEPTAAALSYGLHKAQDETKFMVVDLGGGTLDVSVVELFENMIEVKSSTGDNQLGGEDFTAVLKEVLAEQMSAQAILSHAITGYKQATLTEHTAKVTDEQQRSIFLAHQAERCKLALSSEETVEWQAAFQGVDYPFCVTQSMFDSRSQALLLRLRKAVERALRDAKMSPTDLNDVVLVGGASRMPIVQHYLRKMLGKALNTKVQPDEAIALGAAIMAGLYSQDSALDEVMMTDVCPYSLGVAVHNPTGSSHKDGDVFSPIIERNTLIPVSRAETYSPAQDFQKTVELQVYQGEARYVRDNILLGKLEIALPARKKEELTIEVRFSYDVSGLLDIDATVQPAGQKHSLTLLGHNNGLSEADIATSKARLAGLKISPREQQPNRALIARLERLYQEYLGDSRDAVGQAHQHFLSILNKQHQGEISRLRARINTWCDQLENNEGWDENDGFESDDSN